MRAVYRVMSERMVRLGTPSDAITLVVVDERGRVVRSLGQTDAGIHPMCSRHTM